MGWEMKSINDPEEFVRLIEEHRHEFYRYILRTVWDSGVADDVFSSAVLVAFENRHKFRTGTNFRAWVYRILTNKCFVANREIGRAASSLDADPTTIESLAVNPEYLNVLDDPESFLEQCGDEVYRALRSLSTAQRSCLLLQGVERFSYKEIADILEIPVGTVMTHLSRGRAKLRKELLDYAKESGIIRAFPRLVQREKDSKGKERSDASL